MTTRQFQESSALRIFLSYFKPHRKLFFLDMCCALMIAVIDLAFPYVSRWCMYQLLPESAYRTFFAVMAVVFCAYILRSVFTYIICYYGHTFGILVEADIRRDLFRHMQELSFDYYDRNRTGQLMSRLTADLFDITELAHHGPEDIFISGVTIVGALAIMFTIQWQLALVIACIIPVFFLVVWKCRKSMQDASIKVKQRTATINADIESGLSGIKTAKAFANEEAELEKFDVSNDSFKTSKRAFHRAMGRFNAVMEFFGPGVANLSMDYRAGIDVMTTETSCLSSIWETDSVVQDALTILGRGGDYRELHPKNGACYDAVLTVDLEIVEPMIALPFHPSILPSTFPPVKSPSQSLCSYIIFYIFQSSRNIVSFIIDFTSNSMQRILLHVLCKKEPHYRYFYQ